MTAPGGLLVPFPRSLESYCGLCRGRIVWARTAAHNRRVPLEWEPAADGNQAVARDAHGTVWTRQLRDGEAPDGHERRMAVHMPECARRRQARAARAVAEGAAVRSGKVTNLAEWRRRRGSR